MNFYKVIFLLTLLFNISVIQAQNNDLRARVEFEEAETAFVSEQYSLAIQHLISAQSYLKRWTPKVSYLLIKSLSKDISKENPDSTKLVLLNDNIHQYQVYANNSEDIDIEKYKEIISIEREFKNVNDFVKFKNEEDYQTGERYYDDEEYNLAKKHYELSANRGNPLAMEAIGDLYYWGEGVEVDYQMAMNWYTKAAHLNCASAMKSIAMLYYLGKGVQENLTEAKKWCQKAIDLGLVSSMYLMGMIYNNEQTQQSYAQAFSWFEKAAKYENNQAYKMLGDYYRLGRGGVAKDVDKAILWYSKAADNDVADGAMRIGEFYFHGDGVTKNLNKAAEWFIKASALSNDRDKPKVYAMVGITYFNDSKYKEAMQWYMEAHKLGLEEAKYKIADLYEYGLGVEKNKRIAKEWRNK